MNINSFRTYLTIGIAAVCLATANSALAVAEADFFIGYDESYATSFGGDENVYVYTAAAVSYANAVENMSDTGRRFRICGYHKTTGQYQATDLASFVSWLSNESDGHLDDVTAAANAAGADLLAYICRTTDSAYAAVTDSVGGRYTCYNDLWFAGKIISHELGHAYGCEHRIGHGEPVTTIMLHNYCGKSDGYFSNPNVWYNGINLLGDGGCLGPVVQGGDAAWLISEAAQGKADYKERMVAAPSLDHVVRHWVFNQTAGSAPAGTTVTDSVTGSALAIVQGNGATFTGSGLQIPGGDKYSGLAYLQLPGGIISGYSEVTIEIWAKTLAYQYDEHLFDFNNGASESIRLRMANSVSIQYPSLVSTKDGTTVSTEMPLGNLPDAEGLLHHHVITYTSTGASTGRWSWYRDGFQLFFIDVDYALTSFQDVNNWLGKSAYSLANLGNYEYQEVRISNVAMSRGQILSNYKLGVNYDNDATVKLTDSDTSPSVSLCSFTSAGNWDSGSAPTNGYDYETFGFHMWAPRDGDSHTFAGDSLRISSGKLQWNNWADSSLTVNDLRLSGAEMVNSSDEGKTLTLAGNLSVERESQIRAQEGEINLTADLSGTGDLLYLRNAVTLSGNNSAFTGKTLVGDGRFSRLRISSEAQLGPNPAAFTADQLTLNRGILETTQSMTIDDSNRGIRIETDAGFLNAWEGTTLTIDCPISSPAAGNTLQTAPLDSNPIEGILFFGGDGTVELTNPNNSHNAEMQITWGELKLSGNGRINNGNHWMPFLVNGTFTDNSALDQTLSGALSGSGAIVMSAASTLTLSGASTFSGSTTVSNGTLMLNGSSFSGSGTITVAGGTLGGTGTAGGSLTVQSGGTLSPGASIGTLAVNGNATLQSGGITHMEINASTDSSDLLDVSGNMTLAGTLQVVNLDGTLIYGDNFMLFDADSIFGSFSSYDLPELDAGLQWDTNNIQNGFLVVDSTTPSAPPAPSGLQVFTLTDTQLSLEWSPAVSAASYTVKRSDSSGGPYTIIASGITDTTFIDSGITAGATYYYVVSAVNAIGESPDSSVAQGATVPTVGDDSAFAVGEWNFDQNLSYAGTALSTHPATDITGNGNTMYGYDPTYGPVYSELGDTPSGSGLSIDANGGQDAYLDDDVSSPTFNLNTWSPQKWTVEASVVMDDLGDWETFIGKDGTIHAQSDSDFYLQKTADPGDVRVSLSTVSGQRIDINTGYYPTVGQWFHLVVTSDGRTLSIYLNDGTGWSLKGSAALTGDSAANNALANGGGANWTFLRGWYGGGFGDHVDGRIDNIRFSQGARTPEAFLYDSLTKPATPTGLVASALSSDEIGLSWSASADAIGYYVKRSISTGGPYTVVGETSSTNFNDTGLTAGTTYYYVVAAISSDTASEDSAEVSATPTATMIEPDEYQIADHAVEGGTNLLLTVSNSVLGHLYGILATDSLTPPAWTNIIVEPGSGSNVQFNIPIDLNSTNRYFKLDVQSQ